MYSICLIPVVIVALVADYIDEASASELAS
jgi:hypothetical protein